jgi:hypothetical protein
VIYVSIDVEASGPFPGLYSLLSVGAVPVRKHGGRWSLDREAVFYAELRPLEGAAEDPEAMAVHGLTRAHLDSHGQDPAVAMGELARYLRGLGGPFRSAAWPSSFDHPYVAWYLQRFLGENPLGHSGLDIASFAMGLFSTTSRRATLAAMKAAGYRAPHNPHPHHAKWDAIEQGETLGWLLDQAEHR